MTGTLDRRQVLAYRYTAHDLGPGGGRAATVLATGIQDYPPGRSASLALRLRTETPPPTVLVHSIRGAMHLHRPADLPRLAAALKFDDGRELAEDSIGPFGAELAGSGIAFDAALDEPVEPADQRQSRADLVRAFLAAFGPARPAHLASWLGCTPAAARRWFEQEAEPWVLDAHRREVPEPRGLRLLPPYDPITELADRAFLVPDPAQRRKVWRAAANPGIVLSDGEIVGVWRQRRARNRLTLRIEPFAALPARDRRAAEADAATIADHVRAPDVELVYE